MSILAVRCKAQWQVVLREGIDTKKLQQYSLLYFLRAIGYDMTFNKEGVAHIEKTKGICNSNPKFMKLDHAVNLHNGTTMKTNGTICEYRDYTFNLARYKKARDGSILQAVHLQRCHSEEDGLKVTTNWVHFN